MWYFVLIIFSQCQVKSQSFTAADLQSPVQFRVFEWGGWSGSRNRAEPEIFILLDEAYRNRGYGTQCVRKLLRIAAQDYALNSVHGGCAKENIASARAMEKGGMVRDGTEENGDPLFRFCANTGACQEGNTCG